MKNRSLLVLIISVVLIILVFVSNLGDKKANTNDVTEFPVYADREEVNPIKFNLREAALAYKSGDYLKCEECLKKTQDLIKQKFSPFMTPEGSLDITKMNQSLASQGFQAVGLIQDMETMAQMRMEVATCLWYTNHKHKALAALKALVDFGRTYPLSETTRIMITTNLKIFESWTEKESEKNSSKK